MGWTYKHIILTIIIWILSKFAIIKIQLFFKNKNIIHLILNTTETILENAKQSILSQSDSIAKLTQYLTEDFAKTVQLIFESKGRLVVTGIGKKVPLLLRKL